jgi:predicted metalloprotease
MVPALHTLSDMKWTRGYKSDDVEVRRGGGGGMGGSPQMLGGILSLVVSRFGLLGGAVVVGGYLLLSHFAGGGGEKTVDPTVAGQDTRVQFVSFVLDDVQQTWARKFAASGGRYSKAKLTIYENGTTTGCGYGQAAVGPFYCPEDQHVYLDLSFFKTMEGRLKAGGDFAQAYVIAHEVGHHVQNQLGLTDAMHANNPHATMGANGLSVKMELQADCFAGVWAHETQKRDTLEGGDLEEAINAAGQIGDDRLQREAKGTVQPESWTHGSSAQRVEWFKKGYSQGSVDACDTSKLAAR